MPGLELWAAAPADADQRDHADETLERRVRHGPAQAFEPGKRHYVNGHGSEGTNGTCGVWGVGYDTGTGTLSRDAFHNGNYRAEMGKTCYAVAEDRSCHSGLSASGRDWLNNLGLVNCGNPPRKHKHEYHAGFFEDMVMTTSSAANTCSMGTMTARDYFTGDLISKAGTDLRRLAQAFLVEGVGHDATGYYRDRGYNKLPDTICKGPMRKY